MTNPSIPLRRSLFPALAAVILLGALPLAAQTPPAPTPAPAEDIQVTIRGAAERRLPIAVPELFAPSNAAIEAKIAAPFTATLRSDLEYVGAFAVAEPALYPPGGKDPTTPDIADRWLGTGAEALVDTRGEVAGDKVSIEARIWDLKSRKRIMGMKYTGGISYVERIAHTLANDIVKYFTGKPGIFLSTIVFVTEQAPNKEISAMDFDGRSVRQLTSHKSIAISPSGANGKIVYTSYVRLFPNLWTMDYDGGAKREIPTGVDLNASPSLSSDGAQIAFAGSAKGNPDIYVVPVAGGTARRLTTSRALEASPAWSPNGRQILYTSDLTGTPQLYVMDAEGTGSRRVTFAGNWNDEGAWSPDGSRIAFACRNEGDFNICVMDMEGGRTVQLTSEGSNGRPTWSPDGEKIVYQCRRDGSTQIYTMDANGQNKRQLTRGGNHSQPAWLP